MDKLGKTTGAMNLIELYRRVFYSRTYEHLEPFVFGPLVGVVCYWRGFVFPTDTSVQLSILGASMTAGSIVFGFMSTAMVMLLGLEGSRVRQFENSGYLKDLVSYLKEAIYFSFAFVALNLAGFFLDAGKPAFMALWLGLAVAIMVSFRRVFVLIIWLMQKPN